MSDPQLGLDIEPEELDTTAPTGTAQAQAATAAGRRELGGRLAGLSLPRQVAVLAIWPFLEQVLNFLVGFVDLLLAGHLAQGAVPATDAIGVGAYVAWLIGLLQGAVGVGAGALIARAIGARHQRLANTALGQACVLAAAAGLLMAGLVISLAPQIAGFTHLSGESAEFCVTYLRIVAAAAPFGAVLFVGAACLRAAGDTRTPFWVLMVVNVVNTVMSIALVWGPAPLGGHGVAGIAGGTFLGYAVGCVTILVTLVGGWGGIRLRWIRLRPHLDTMRRIIKVGLPQLAESFIGMWVANFLVIRIVGSLGRQGVMGAHVIAIRLEAVSYLPGFAMGIAAATLAGQYLGAGDPPRARQAVLLCWKIGVAVMFTMGVVFIAIPHVLVHLVTQEPALLAMSAPLLRTTGFVQVFFATAIVLGQGMRGAGDTRTTMLLTAASTYGVRLPLAYFFGVSLGLGLTGVWFGLCGELAFRGCLFAARFFHGGWLKARV